MLDGLEDRGYVSVTLLGGRRKEPVSYETMVRDWLAGKIALDCVAGQKRIPMTAAMLMEDHPGHALYVEALNRRANSAYHARRLVAGLAKKYGVKVPVCGHRVRSSS